MVHSRLTSRFGLAPAVAALCAIAGCAAAAEQDTAEAPAIDTGTIELACTSDALNGKKLFEEETFGGNGRTCQTCHAGKSGSISPADAQKLFAKNPNAPLFRPIDSDDGVGASYSRLLADATVRVTIPLPAGWKLAGDPTATSVTFARGIPSTNNVPSLDTIFMVDGRNTTLEAQALGAVNAHAQPGRQPTFAELGAIADHQRTNDFISNSVLRKYAQGRAAPQLPPGTTESEKRGRNWYVPSAGGVCGHCHAGPMLNQTSEFLLNPLPVGTRFFTAFVSELNKKGTPPRTFEVTQPDGTITTVTSPDPGRALVTGNVADVNFFRIPTLWGAKDTAPYFHDNSVKTLEQLAQHYSDYFQAAGLPPLSAQEQVDILAYLKLL
jgi:cytochrome c peroxidase